MTFALFDPERELTVRYGKLPHWYQPGVTYFITIRTVDSVPQGLQRSWHLRRADWLYRHGIDPKSATWKDKLREQSDLEREFDRTFSRQFMEYLDRGHGACPLAQRSLPDAVADSLKHFDGVRYHLGDFVVMPNHVHLLVRLLGRTEIDASADRGKGIRLA